MNQERPLTDKRPDNMAVTDSIAVISQKQADKFVIDCDKIVLKDSGIDIIIHCDCFDYTMFKELVINGVTYKRVEERDDRDDPFLKYELGL